MKRAKLPKGAAVADALVTESLVVALVVADSAPAPASFVLASVENTWVELAKLKSTASGLAALGSQLFVLDRDGNVVVVDTSSGKTTKERVAEQVRAMRGLVPLGLELIAFGEGPGAFLRLKSGRWIDFGDGLGDTPGAIDAVAFAGTRICAVGEVGLLREREREGKWAAVEGPTRDAIVCAAALGNSLFAGTDRGALLERRPKGMWTTVASHLAGTLHGLAALGDDLHLLADGRLVAWTGSRLSSVVDPAVPEEGLRSLRATQDGLVVAAPGAVSVRGKAKWRRIPLG